MNNQIVLPPHNSESVSEILHAPHQLTIIGANGVGKTRFMNYVAENSGRPVTVLSAISAFNPTDANKNATSIDRKYALIIPSAIQNVTLSQLDKLIRMLFHEEFASLLRAKADKLLYGKPIKIKPTKLDRTIELWQEVFPGSQIMSESGTLLFANENGDNLIGSSKLSSGEKAVLYYIAAVLYAEPESLICIDNPSVFLHPAILNTVWNAIEGLRQDCTFIYNTSDMEFVNSRTGNQSIWVKGHNAQERTWNYEVLGKGVLPEELFVDIMGSRRPVLFIEGDSDHSIDAKLYPLVFPKYTVRPLGSCNKVIESTRAFNDLNNIHKLESRGLVDRDRRTVDEVNYLRRKKIMVPEVAEIENIFLVEDVIKLMASYRKRNPDLVFDKVRKTVQKMFSTHLKEQALQHVRHRMKRALEFRGDAKVHSIDELENHLFHLPQLIDVRSQYVQLEKEFRKMSDRKDYGSILRVFNHKPMLSESRVANLLGYKDKDAYIVGILNILKNNSSVSTALRKALQSVFAYDGDDAIPI